MFTIQEGYELVPCPLGAECEGNGRQAADGIESEEDVVVLDVRLAMLGWDCERGYARTLSSSIRTAMGYSSSP